MGSKGVALGISALISLLECRCHSGFGPPFEDLDHSYQTFLLSILCIIFGN